MVKRQSLKRSVEWSFGNSQTLSGFQAPRAREQKLIYSSQTFKSHILSKFMEVSPCAQFVDIGVNVGQTMVEILSLYPELEYHGFEPNIEALCCAQAVANSHGFIASLYPWACAGEAAPQNFFAESNLDTSATIISAIRPDTYADVQAQAIAAYPLDQVFFHQAKYGFVMKIDVEGGENEVLMGAQKLLMHRRPLIICEVLNAHRDIEIAMNNSRKAGLERLLADANYQIQRIELDFRDREAFLGLKPIDAFPRNLLWRDSPHQCDYVFIPDEISLNC